MIDFVFVECFLLDLFVLKIIYDENVEGILVFGLLIFVFNNGIY